MLDKLDASSSLGASKLASMIRDYWIAAGYPEIKTEIVEIRSKNGMFYYGVRSNMVGGFPPRTVNA